MDTYRPEGCHRQASTDGKLPCYQELGLYDQTELKFLEVNAERKQSPHIDLIPMAVYTRLSFLFVHRVMVPTVVKHYQDEIKCLMGVLESAMSKQESLVEGKFDIVDIVSLHSPVTTFIQRIDEATRGMFGWNGIAACHYLPEGSYDSAKEASHAGATCRQESMGRRETSGTRIWILQVVAAAHQRIADTATQQE
ncbi:hypothetical protein GLOTRDRAFT_134170 [Gloeophyllum trabeum ATCC 11539]|uniref:Uncharacterized protein n=1 Tax=Gloeophyllum trabeum (strain ATCC 11539 / FP-39264 / Madison 617) TaxID=670483 RepID=S7PS33_GLOTA|nr:uncharacterized protein GLOTRDRAFT_134170 [Gloeophyllum trabeum ATCC 11539]EPQ50192.1 hypothetical protein GLOTRDRAFT_134170 [Gloeophyllum trabeum ATCC 11539]